MSDAATIKAFAVKGWESAVQAFAASLRACGFTLDTQFLAALDDELRRSVADHEHIGLTDLELLNLAHARLMPGRIAAAARSTEVVIAQIKAQGLARGGRGRRVRRVGGAVRRRR